MERDERQELRAASDEVGGWIERARSVLAGRAHVEAAGSHAVAQLRHAVVEIRHDGRLRWRVLPLRQRDEEPLGLIAHERQLPVMTPTESELLDRLLDETASSVRQSRTATGARRLVVGGKRRQAGAEAARYLRAYRDWAIAVNLAGLIERSAPAALPVHGRVSTEEALSDWVGLAPRLRDLGRSQEALPVATVAHLRDAVQTIEGALRREQRYRADAVKAAEELRRHEVERLLQDMPVARLKEATRDRLRITPLTDAGITTVQAVLAHGSRLEHLPGIGPTTATRMRGAAQTLWQTTYDEMPVRIDLKDRSRAATELLRRLSAWDAMRQTKGATTDLAWTESLAPLAEKLDAEVSHLLLLSEEPSSASFHEAVEAVTSRGRSLTSSQGQRGRAGTLGRLPPTTRRLLRDAVGTRLPDRRRGEDPRRPPRPHRRCGAPP